MRLKTAAYNINAIKKYNNHINIHGNKTQNRHTRHKKTLKKHLKWYKQ